MLVSTCEDHEELCVSMLQNDWNLACGRQRLGMLDVGVGSSAALCQNEVEMEVAEQINVTSHRSTGDTQFHSLLNCCALFHVIQTYLLRACV